jgi:hypothetical protein
VPALVCGRKSSVSPLQGWQKPPRQGRRPIRFPEADFRPLASVANQIKAEALLPEHACCQSHTLLVWDAATRAAFPYDVHP